jgi:lysozyme
MTLRNRLLALGVPAFLAAAGASIGLHEGLPKPVAGMYPIYADVGGVATWCYGQTGMPEKTRYTLAECDKLLAKDVVARWAQIAPVIPDEAPDSVKSVMLSISYHTGVAGWRHPVFLKPLAAHDWRAACAAIVAPWPGKYGIAKGFKATVQGRPHRGLENRRAEEYRECVKGL